MANKNDLLTIEDGVLTNYDGDAKALVIPEHVIKIGRSAFAVNKSLTSITIPGSVREIGDEAFYGCESLESVTLLGNPKMGADVFKDCGSLKR